MCLHHEYLTHCEKNQLQQLQYLFVILLIPEMQFTPQQMSGGPKFSSTTKIGNWLEDKALDGAKLLEFKERASKGNLQLRKLRAKVSKCSQPVGFHNCFLFFN